MITLTPLFISLPSLCLLSLYPGHIQRLNWYLPESRLWMRRWKFLLLDKLGSWFDTNRYCCCWLSLVFTLKYRPDRCIDRYKAKFVAKSHTQTYDIDYFETFSPVARMNSIRILFSIVVNMSWSLFQLDVKNAFLYGDLQESSYGATPRLCCSMRDKSLSSQEGHIWKGVVWEVQPYYFWYWLLLVSFRSLCLHSVHKVWHCSSDSLCWSHFADWEWLGWDSRD